MGKDSLDEVKSKLMEMNQVIIKLDPAIRSAAFDIMVPYYFKDKVTKRTKGQAKPKGSSGAGLDSNVDTSDLSAFIGNFESIKPKDNVMLLVAWLYSQYGAYPIQVQQIKDLASECGMVIPNRSDNTLRQAKDKGKSLFNQQGKGWKLTVSGELFIQGKYNVKKGNNSFPKD